MSKLLEQLMPRLSYGNCGKRLYVTNLVHSCRSRTKSLEPANSRLLILIIHDHLMRKVTSGGRGLSKHQVDGKSFRIRQFNHVASTRGVSKLLDLAGRRQLCCPMHMSEWSLGSKLRVDSDITSPNPDMSLPQMSLQETFVVPPEHNRHTDHLRSRGTIFGF